MDLQKQSFQLNTKTYLNDMVIGISNKQRTLLGLDENIKEVILHVGSRKVHAKIVKAVQPDDELTVSNMLLAELYLFGGVRLRILHVSGNRIWLGPIMAIMVNTIAFKRLSQGKGLKELVVPEEWARENGYLMYFMSVHDVLWKEKLIKGVIYHPAKKAWEARWLPFPNAIYDQATFPFNPEHLIKAKDMLARFKAEEGVCVLNPKRTFGKYEIATCLNFYQETRQYIPDFILVEKAEDLSKFLEKWPYIYVKGEYGSYGDQVARVHRVSKGIECGFGGEERENKVFASMEDVFARIKQRYGETKIMAQQGIKLQKLEGRNFDLRVIVQKNNLGQWKINLVAARLAPINSVVTNISSGGKEVVVEKDNFSATLKNITWEELEKHSVKCAAAIEGFFGRHAEIGLDFGLDETGQIWLFEANSKPSTMDYLGLAKKETAFELYLQPMFYTDYLSRQWVKEKAIQNSEESNTLPLLLLSSHTCRSLKLTTGKKLIIKAGKSSYKAIIAENPSASLKDDQLSLCKLLGLPFTVNFGYSRDTDNTLTIQPIKAFITKHDIFVRTELLPELAKYLDLSKPVLKYICSVDDINLENMTAAGYQVIKENDKISFAPCILPLAEQKISL